MSQEKFLVYLLLNGVINDHTDTSHMFKIKPAVAAEGQRAMLVIKATVKADMDIKPQAAKRMPAYIIEPQDLEFYSPAGQTASTGCFDEVG